MPSVIRTLLDSRERNRSRRGWFTPRAAVLGAAVMLILLIVLDLVIYGMSAASVEHVLASSPDLALVLKGQLRLHLLLIVFASVAFFAGVLVIGALENHRTAGLVAKLAMHLERVEHGRYNVELRFRRDDQLEELQAAFNRMNQALRDRTCHEVERLEQLAESASHLQTEEDRRRLSARIHELAVTMRRAVE
jgi:methyl-accepting chemotaxis protein